MPCPFTGHKMFCASPIFLCQTKKMNRILCHFKQFCAGTITYALSFYRSQNVLSWSKFFVPYQKLIYILCQTKRWVSYSKFSFCAGTKLFGGALKFNSILGLAQNIWTGTKHFGSCRRTRQPLYRESKEEEKTTLPVDIRRAKKILTSAGMSTNMISVV